MSDDGEDLVAFFSDDGEAGGAGGFRAEADFGHAEFDVLDEFDFGIEVEQRGVPAVEFAGLVPAAGGGEFPEDAVFVGEGVDQAGDPAGGAEEGGFEDEVVDAGEHEIAIAEQVDDVGDAADVVGRFFDGDEGGLVGEFGEHVGGEVDGVGDGVVVDHDRQAGSPGDATEVGEGFAAVGFVDHGGEDHEAVDADGFAVACVAGGGGGGEFGDA